MSSLSGASPPPALRARRPGWRDPRLWVGVAIVAASVLLGAKVLGDADDSVAVWTAAADLPAGTALSAADLTTEAVRFADAGDLDDYVPASESIPDGSVVARDVGSGELLPRAALADPDQVPRKTLTLDAAGAPSGLSVGDHVDVYVTSVSTADDGSATPLPGAEGAVLRLSGVTVTDVTQAAGDFGGGAGGTTVSIALPDGADAQADIGAVVQAAKTDNLYLVRVD